MNRINRLKLTAALPEVLEVPQLSLSVRFSLFNRRIER